MFGNTGVQNDGRDSQDSRSGAAAQRDVASPSGLGQTFEHLTPSINLPKGGGAIRGIGEKFAANPVTGTGNVSIPILVSPGRGGSGPALALNYDSGAGNGLFGIGWLLAPNAITRKTDKGIPQYRDEEESDVYLLDGVEDLVPVRNDDGSVWNEVRDGYRIRRYRPRIDGAFARIERCTRLSDGDTYWQVTSAANVTSIYGQNMDSRIAEANDTQHVFTWLLCSTVDDKGNGSVFEYVAEDSRNVDVSQHNERNRTPQTRSVHRYLKRIKYGNRQSLLVQPDLSSAEWLFEVVFDYDEQHVLQTVALDDHGAGQVEASIDAGAAWRMRPDAYSMHRSGFELRCYRRCRRVLMFHRMSELGDLPYLVGSTEFNYNDIDLTADPDIRTELAYTGSTRFASQLQSVTHARYQRRDAAPVQRNGVTYQSYDMQILPPVEFEYTRAVINEAVEDVAHDSIVNLPAGFDDGNYRWLDLEGEGLPGVLTEQGGAWFYKPNRSPLTADDNEQMVASFAPLQQIAKLPQPSALQSTRQWLDLDGDGELNLTELSGFTPGFFERTADENWRPYRAFEQRPNIDWQDPNLRLVDLTGDGLPDVLITEQDVLTWHGGEGEAGFTAAQRVYQSLDEEQGPRVLFADGTQSIFLADMTGDGLIDIVRIRNAEVCYWPNLGYGRFGAKVSFDNAPLFESLEQFDTSRIRLADITGSGTVDIIYLKRDGAVLYFNQCGNRLSTGYQLAMPRIDNSAYINAVDLLGNGTASLVWNSPLAANGYAPMRYVRLLQDKPYLLSVMRNNAGAETRVSYTPSTRFYLQDLRDGKPWITKLPFPVHVVERVEAFDAISRNRFTSRYAYHHGYFDGPEREFRGFAMVEQWDTDAYEDYVEGVVASGSAQDTAPQFYQPPVLTRTWFHTGAFINERPMLHQLQHEYFSAQAMLSDAIVPDDLNADEHRECLRALKGAVLRSEVYSYDGSASEHLPYHIAENRYEVLCLQHAAPGQHAVFMRLGRESVSAYYERNISDPRITHAFNLEYGPYGNVLKSASVVYGRQVADLSLPSSVRNEQAARSITYAETDYTPDIDQASPRVYRLRVPYESRVYEITGVAPAGSLFQLDELAAAIATTSGIAYETVADNVTPQKRLLSQHRGLFLDNSLNPLPLGQWDTLGLGAQSFTLALTDTIVAAHYAGHVSDAELLAAGYVHFDGDAHWWIPSSVAVYPDHPETHFYIPLGTRNPFGIESRATFDHYDLLIEQVQVVQAAWNVTSVVNDYRILGPVFATDPNGNRAAIRVDVLGQVIATAVMGKEGSSDGDTLDDPTTRLEYDLFNYIRTGQPNVVHTYAREQHGAANTRWLESYTYTNGMGGVALVKAQAHPGKALKVDSNGNAVEVDADPRWVGNGRVIRNNKGNPVKKYEPYFSVTYEYENERALRELGVTPLFYYDALGRNVRTDYPDGTYARVEFTPWLQRAYGVGDTVRDSQWYADRGSPDPAVEPEPAGNASRRAAWLAAKNANTPSEFHFDNLGRPCYTISDYGGGVVATTHVQRDLTSRYVKAFDQLGREVSSGTASMLGAALTATSAEKGQRWTFFDITGAMIKTWDAQGRMHRALFDDLRRPIGIAITEPGQSEHVWNAVVYGDRNPNAQQLNLLGVPHMLFDQSGQVRIPSLDFKGLPTRAERLLTNDYQNVVDWNSVVAESNYNNIQTTADPLLETGEVFVAAGTYDALGRPMRVTLPDNTVMVPTYDVGGMLTTLSAQIRGQGAFIDFLREQDYNAKGQRQYASLGNGLITSYFYDPQSFRLVRLLTKADGAADATALQDLNYEYDAVGNIVQVSDDAQQTFYFNNAVVRPESLFEYDAVNQLIRATGRELAGGVNDDVLTSADMAAIPQLPYANNDTAVRTYTEEYSYDLAGNITLMKHRFKNQAGIGAGWTRHYHYAYQDDAANCTNRLMSSSMPGDADAGPYTGTHQYDVYGNMIRMPNLAQLDWNAMDQLHHVDLGGGGNAYYVYDTGGQRVRKVIDRNGSLQLEWIFLGGLMIFRRRRRDTGQLLFERSTIHVSDNTGVIAQVDTKTVDVNNDDPSNALNEPLIRYQYGNHLGSSSIETDTDGHVVSYEEYHPFGSTAYRANIAGYDISLKRFRYSGKERDDESGLYYFGARYYAPWLGRWTSADPAGFVRGFNLYRYCSNNPVMMHDPNGMDDDVTVTAPADSPLRDPNQEAAARRYIENDITARFGNGTRVLHIDAMHYVRATRSWLIDTWHWEDRPASDGGEGDGSGDGDSAGADSSDSSSGDGGDGSSSSSGSGGTGDSGSGAGSGSGDTGSGAGASGSGDTTADASSSDAASGSGTSPGTGSSSSTGAGDGSSSTSDPSPGANSLTQAGPALEDAIWARSFRDRGFTLEHLYNNRIMDAIRATGDNRPLYDVETATEILQIKSSNSMSQLARHASRATRDAGEAITVNGGSMVGKSPRAVVITPTDIPAGAGAEINRGYSAIRRPVPNSTAPEYVRGIPGRVGSVTRGLTYAGTGLSAIAFGSDLYHGDYPMAGADGLSTAGGALEIYAMSTEGATLFSGTALSVSAMSAGTALGGAGAAIGFGIQSYRAFKSGDTAGGIVDALGAIGGLLLIASLFTPVGWVGLLGVGLVAFAGGFNLGRWLSN